MKSSSEKNQGPIQKDKKNTLLPFGAFRTIIKSSSKDILPKHTSRSAISFEQDIHQISPRTNGSNKKEEKLQDDSSLNAQNLEKKRELQRNLQDHYATSNLTQRSFTNALSQRIAEKKRPNLKVEDILLGKGRESKHKIKQLEQDLYGKVISPPVGKKPQKTQKDDSIYQRLHELERERNASTSRRETMDAKIPKSGSSPKFMLNHNASQRSLSGDSKLKASNSPLKASLTEILSKAGHNKSVLSPSKFDMSTLGSPTSNYGLSSPNPSSARFLKPKTHNEGKPGSSETARDFSYIPIKKGKEIEQKIEEKTNESFNNQSFNQESNQLQPPKRGPSAGYKTLSGFNSPDSTKSVLPNMLFFKNQDKKNKIIRTDQNFAHSALDIKEKSSNPEDQKGKPQDKKKQNEIQRFYTKIAQLDFKNSNPFESPRDKKTSDIGQRTQDFLNKKNEKIQSQKINNLSRELSECTFQPQFATIRTVKSATKDANMFERARRVSGEIVSPSRNYIKEKPKTVENSANKEQNAPPNRLVPNRENDPVQKKLYEYMLNK